MIYITRVTEEWQRAGVHYVRTEGMVKEFDVSLEQEFEGDHPDDTYILAFDDKLPVSTCRLKYLDETTAKIERVCTIGSYRSKGIGAQVIKEAEAWMKEKGVKKVQISSREAALNFYLRLGYQPDYSKSSGAGLFRCILVEKEL